MHKLSFYPLGNADTTLISLENGKDVLFDFANMANPDDPNEKRANLGKELRDYMEGRDKNAFDVVAFTHGDNDHTKGASEFFYLEHAKEYQGEDRFKIEQLWVPAAMIVEEGTEDCARVIRQEARYRLLKGSGIQVFSRPEQLKDFLEENGLTIEARQHLITDAGSIAKGLTLINDGVEFFVHSPFAHRQDEETVIDRNNNCLVMQATFSVSGMVTRLLLLDDIEWEPLDELIAITRLHKRDARLSWDICRGAHHCSAYSLNKDKGKTKTVPTANIDWLYGQRGNGAIMVFSCDPIPASDTDQPPHCQASNYYKAKLDEIVQGKFLVTMSEPSEAKPKKIEIDIGIGGAKHLLRNALGGAVLTDRSGPRVG